jgi:hypothetical protein
MKQTENDKYYRKYEILMLSNFEVRITFAVFFEPNG